MIYCISVYICLHNALKYSCFVVFSALSCPPNTEYSELSTACHPTCADPFAPATCALPDTENCLCPDGQLLEDDQCVAPDRCGCIDKNNVRHEVKVINIV